MRKLLVLLIISQFSYSQERYITDEEFKEKVTWLLPHEENLPLIDVINKVPGYRGKGRWEVDGILHVNIPVGIISSHVKYIEIPQSVTSFSAFSECNCNIIIKTVVTEKEFNSRKNILNRLNLKRSKKRKKKNRYDKFSKRFYINAQKAFIKLAKKNRNKYRIYDNSVDGKKLEKEILKVVLSKLK